MFAVCSVHVTNRVPGLKETRLAVGGDEVWAADSGGDLPPLILVHPGVGDSRIWDPILPALTATNRVIRYDARGYGRSPAPTEPYTLLDDLVTVPPLRVPDRVLSLIRETVDTVSA